MQEIYELELKLLSREIRSSPDDLDELLADNFIEIGSSGKVYGKDEVIRSLLVEKQTKFTITDFETRSLSPTVVLATYQVEKTPVESGSSQRSLRSSIWKASDDRWEMSFHQGTPIEYNPK
jgi:hypothetical protein